MNEDSRETDLHDSEASEARRSVNKAEDSHLNRSKFWDAAVYGQIDV
jgi:hypothetical protein